jgi:hypothetical protein
MKSYSVITVELDQNCNKRNGGKNFVENATVTHKFAKLFRAILKKSSGPRGDSSFNLNSITKY